MCYNSDDAPTAATLVSCCLFDYFTPLERSSARPDPLLAELCLQARGDHQYPLFCSAEMTTFLLPSAIYGKTNTHCRSRRRHLLDRFWDAVHLDSPESPSNDNIFFFGKIDGYDDPGTPEIFARRGCNPTVDVRAPWNSPTASSFPCQPSAFIAPPTIMVQSPLSPSPVDLQSASTRKGFLGRNPSKPVGRWPKLSIPRDLKPRAPGITSPATAILAMASNFLDDLVKLTRSQSPNLNTTMVGSPDGDVEVVDSEVYIDVIDETKRTGIHSISDLQEGFTFEKLELPPTPLPITAIPAPEPDGNQSLRLLSSTPDSAKELDALSRLDRDRQLSNLICSIKA